MDTKEIKGVKIVRIISETKKPRGERPRPGYRRVEAVVQIRGRGRLTRHGDTTDGKLLMMKVYGEKKPTRVPKGMHVEQEITRADVDLGAVGITD